MLKRRIARSENFLDENVKRHPDAASQCNFDVPENARLLEECQTGARCTACRFKENISLALTKDQCVTNIILNFQYLRRHAYAAKIETRTMERA